MPYKVVGTAGAPALGLDVIADATVDGLNGLEAGLFPPYLDYCARAIVGLCWSPSAFPTDSAAFGVEVYQGCKASELMGAYLSGSTLAFDVDVQEHQCAPGAAALAEPSFELVAISISELPAALILVHVYYGGVESPKSSLLDLRHPVPPPPSAATRQAEVEQAINLATSAARGGWVTELAARRFAAGPVSCASPAPTDSQPGYVIALQGDSGEYDYAGGQAVHCPATRA